MSLPRLTWVCGHNSILIIRPGLRDLSLSLNLTHNATDTRPHVSPPGPDIDICVLWSIGGTCYMLHSKFYQLCMIMYLLHQNENVYINIH